MEQSHKPKPNLRIQVSASKTHHASYYVPPALGKKPLITSSSLTPLEEPATFGSTKFYGQKRSEPETSPIPDDTRVSSANISQNLTAFFSHTPNLEPPVKLGKSGLSRSK